MINAALLAPLLMLLLWATLKVAKALHSSGSIGVIVNSVNAPTPDALGILFSYAIVLGLLFASFKLSSDFASSIYGFGNINGAITGLTKYAAGSAAALSAASVALGSQRILGGKALEQEAKYRADARKVAQHMATLDPTSALYGEKMKDFNRLQEKAATANARSKQEFNLMNTALGKTLAKKTGIGDRGQTKTGGAAGMAKKIADDSAKAAEGLKISKDEARALAAKQVETQRAALTAQKTTAEAAAATAEDQRKTLAAQKTAAEEAANAAKLVAEAAKKDELGDPREKAVEDVAKMKVKVAQDSTAHEQDMKSLADAITAAQNDPSQKSSLILQRAAQETSHKAALDRETARIKEAEEKIRAIDSEIKNATSPDYDTKKAALGQLEQDVANAEKEHEKKRAEVSGINQQIATLDKNVDIQTTQLVNNSKENVVAGAMYNAREQLPRSTNLVFGTQVVNATRSTAEKNIKFKDFRDKRAQEKAADKAIDEEAGIKSELTTPPSTGLPPHA